MSNGTKQYETQNNVLFEEKMTKACSRTEPDDDHLAAARDGETLLL